MRPAFLFAVTGLDRGWSGDTRHAGIKKRPDNHRTVLITGTFPDLREIDLQNFIAFGAARDGYLDGITDRLADQRTPDRRGG